MRKPSPLWLLALIPVALLAIYEPYEYIQPGQLPLSVRKNPLAAAERLLERHGHASRHVLSPGTLFPLPDRDTLLVLTGPRNGITADQAADLRAWVRDGGHLVITAPKPAGSGTQDKAPQWRDRAPVLFPLGITSRTTEAPRAGAKPLEFINEYLTAERMFEQLCIEPTAERRERCTHVFCNRDEPLVDSRLPQSGARDRRLALPAGLALRHLRLGDVQAPAPDAPEPVRLVGHADNDWGAQMALFRLGTGRLTVLSGIEPWHNDSLHLLDHAWLLIELASGADEVWIVRDMDMPPLGRWLWQKAWPLILGGLVLLALFLWRRMPRTGPILAPETGHPPDFLDHLSAAGYFLWRTDQAAELLRPLRDEVRRKLAAHPVPRGERYRYIAACCDLDEARVQRAMSDTPSTRDALTEMVSTLQRIRSRL